MKIFKLLGLFILGLIMIPGVVLAGDFDGSKPLICAVIETFECAPGDECQRGGNKYTGIPRFLRIDFKEKKIRRSMKDGKARTTQIERMTRVGGKLILQGIEEGKAWSMLITEDKGKMTVVASDGQIGFIIFGACTSP